MTIDQGQGGTVMAFVHGQVCYLQIPAIDVIRAATFYEKVFGWQVERPYPSVVAPGLIGQWVDDRPPTPDSGVLLWINVDSIEDASDRDGQRRLGFAIMIDKKGGGSNDETLN